MPMAIVVGGAVGGAVAAISSMHRERNFGFDLEYDLYEGDNPLTYCLMQLEDSKTWRMRLSRRLGVRP